VSPVPDLQALLTILFNVVLPVFLIAGIGFAGRRYLKLDPQPIARLALYLLVPALLFQTLLTAKLEAEEVTRIGAFAIILTIALVALGMISARALGAGRAEAAGLTMAMTFINAANYGLPVNLFAFGQDGFDRAAVFVVFENILTYTVGVFVAARGHLPWGRALGSVLRMPVLWAAIAAIAIRVTNLDLPLPVQRASSLLSGAAIPVVILLLGLQIAGMRVRRLNPRVFGAVAARLVVSPLLGLALVALLSPAPLTAKVLVLESAMPTAVNATLIATEFNAEPDLVSTAALFSTVLSIITVTAWVAYLQSI
jgi:malate permease and related proteins